MWSGVEGFQSLSAYEIRYRVGLGRLPFMKFGQFHGFVSFPPIVRFASTYLHRRCETCVLYRVHSSVPFDAGDDIGVDTSSRGW